MVSGRSLLRNQGVAQGGLDFDALGAMQVAGQGGLFARMEAKALSVQAASIRRI